MKKFEIKFEETVCKWLEHIAMTTGQTIEDVIINGIENQVEFLDDWASRTFTYRED